MPDRKKTSRNSSWPPSDGLDATARIISIEGFSARLYQRLQDWFSTSQAPCDIGQCINDLLELVADQVVCDLVEINLYDETSGFFLPNRWTSKQARQYLKDLAVDRYPLSHGYTGWIVEHRSPLLLPDTSASGKPAPVSGLENFPFHSYLGVPLVWHGQILGTLEIAHNRKTVYSESEAEGLQALASQIALALHLLGMHDRVDALHTERKASEAILRLAHHDEDFESLWASVNSALLNHFEMSLLGIFLADGQGEGLSTPFLHYKQGKTWKQRKAKISVPQDSELASVWLLQEYWLSNQVDDGTLARLGLEKMITPKMAAKLLIVPLLAGDEKLGLLIMGRTKKEEPFSEEMIESFQSLNRQLGTVLQLRRTLAQSVASLQAESEDDVQTALGRVKADISPERMTELLRLSAELTTNLDLDRSLRRVLRLCVDLMMADHAIFLTGDPGMVSIRLILPEIEAQNRQVQDLHEQIRLMGEWLISQHQPLVIEDLELDNRWSLAPYHSLCAAACISEADITGTLVFLAKDKAVFGSDELQIAQIVARQMASAMKNSYLYGVIREQAERLGLMLRSQQIESTQSNAILESIADGVIVTDAGHKVILYNDAAERILNMPAAQILGKEVFDHIGIFGPDTLEWSETIHSWKTTPPEQHQLPMLPERMVLDDGRIISILPAPIVLSGDFQGTVSIFRDISRDVEVDRLKSEFVATVSHELRTPMTSIKGFVDLMLMGAAGELNGEQRRFLDIVRTNTNRLEILVNDLLDISRIEAGKASLVFQELDVHQLLGEMEQYIRHRCQEESKSMQITYQDARHLPRIWGDLERVRQILANLVENSFDYTPEGGLINLEARQVDGYVEIEVRDNGMGIALEEQERIFERFYRGEQALIMGVSGTGLGLAIVLNLVEMHKGRIWVTSEGAGKGSTFTVSLPIAPATSRT